MFSGIIESTGIVRHIETQQSNIHFEIEHGFEGELYIDQSIAHNGCCLTIVAIDQKNKTYKVTAIAETLSKTNLRDWRVGSKVNLERCIKANARLDGHFVQGHIDTVTLCTKVEDKNGSWVFTFALPQPYFHLVVDKGSIAVNGTSLTLILDDALPDQFQVAIIPYTYEFTNFNTLIAGQYVNVEFDVLGKYIARLAGRQ
jgi:riboflavin synthase